MDLNNIPEKHKSKLRLLKELPLEWHSEVVNIIKDSDNFDIAQDRINDFLLDRNAHTNNVKLCLVSKFPFGEQRKEERDAQIYFQKILKD